MKMNFDTGLSLEQLENDYWGEPTFDSGLVVSCHTLRKTPIGQLSAGDVRLLIGQKIGLNYLVPVAIKFLSENPILRRTYFEGDLLLSVLGISKEFWDNNMDLFYNFSEIMVNVESIYDTLKNKILPKWGELELKLANNTVAADDKGKLF